MCHCFAALLQVRLHVENLKIKPKQKAISPLAAVHGKNVSLELCLCEYFPLVPYTHIHTHTHTHTHRAHDLARSLPPSPLSLLLKCTPFSCVA
jgi:hypothetical protein